MLRGAASRVGPLALRLREGARYFQEGAHLMICYDIIIDML